MKRRSLREMARRARERNATAPLPEEERVVRRRRKKRTNRHHFFRAKCRGGSMAKQNLLVMDIERHANWHKVFGNMGAEEVLRLLERVVRAKRNQT